MARKFDGNEMPPDYSFDEMTASHFAGKFMLTDINLTIGVMNVKPSN